MPEVIKSVLTCICVLMPISYVLIFLPRRKRTEGDKIMDQFDPKKERENE